ncbi:phosphotriesterase-related protein, partial [Mesorhizobium sp. M1050]|uniref:phosphotriesterase family protein n=1 Tax=Mesorhizobium sp. M1050 TaxID=2957051 RepID=UPI0033388C3B
MDHLFDDKPRERAPIGIRSGTVMTVTGPVAIADMGVTLMHEHILIDGAKSWKCPCHPDEKKIAEQPVSMEIIGELRMNPYMNRDNVSLDDSDLALSELAKYRALGGHTLVDATNIGIGRDPVKLARIARASGLRIVMGTGFYLQHTHPDWLKAMDVDDVTEFLVNDVGGGSTQPEIMAGIIGEVGVSKDFTDEERKSLRASAPAGRRTGVPRALKQARGVRRAQDVRAGGEAEGAALR